MEELISYIKTAMSTEGNPLYSPEWGKLGQDRIVVECYNYPDEKFTLDFTHFRTINL